ncbi:macrophage mannose receptor 1-like [Melanotaenia boesemani]|uniref:macrophage mannose receptor 1-like n=1 Tax=Melanotaenia boesemani TaxID=1250792 RepID=UPI001C04A64A|nr:macrophage mannose receptor 1-like [Melanotaenia boesemani]
MMRNICVYLLLILPPVYGQQSDLRHGILTEYDEKKTWHEAQSFCREKHIDLVTIRRKEDNPVPRNDEVWIGLYQKETNLWKWSRGDEKATYFEWDGGEPNDQNPRCVRSVKGKWRDKGCGENYCFMCFDEKLVLVKENKTWEEALDHCRSLEGENPDSVFWKPSYDLATLITEDDHDYAREKAQQATTDEVWTGLRFLGDGWFWVGGEPVQYQDIPSCPAYGCGVLEKNSNTSFGLRACSQRRNFFCYKRP